jgi:DNA-directed RNA polymerase II subunit RPB2
MNTGQNNSSTFNNELLWNILKSYMSEHKYITKHHLESYNYFIKNNISNILLNKQHVVHIHPSGGNKIYRTIVEFENIRFTDPVQTINKKDIIITPTDARNRNLSYSSKLYVTAIHKQHIIDMWKDTEVTKEIDRREIVLADIPVMIYSDLCILNKEKYKRPDCIYDNGGYFIVNGGEKMCVMQERLVYNRVLVLKKNDPIFPEYYAEINSQNPKNKFKFSSIKIHLRKNNIITISLQLFKNTIYIPAIVIILLCGIDDDKEIKNLILQDSDRELISEYITPFFQYKTILNKKLEPIRPSQKSTNIDNIYNDLKNYLNKDIFGSKQEIENTDKFYIQNELKNTILSHLGNDLIKKGKFICYMINRLLLTRIGQIELTDRDSCFNKRVETTGSILEHMFNHSLKNQLDECKLMFSKRVGQNLDSIIKPPSVIDFIKLDSFNKEFKVAFTKGEIKPLSKSGVFHVYKNISYMDSIAHSRMIRTPSGTGSGSTSKLLRPRYLHNSQYGYRCPVESPEGGNIGLVTFMSNNCSITLENIGNKKKLIDILDNMIINLHQIEHFNIFQYNRVFLDGDWIGYTNDPITLKNTFIKLRREGVINYQYSINLNFNTMEIHMQTDSGRFIRPLLIVNKTILMPHTFITNDKTWDNYKKSNYIEFIDTEESYGSLIALHYSYVDKNNFLIKNIKPYPKNQIVFKNSDNNIKKYTHCEIHPLSILGLSSGCLPFQDCNQAPKDTSSCKYIKQAISIYNPAFRERFDKQAFVLHSPQLPLVGTKVDQITKINKIPTGQNAIVAIAVYSGYNQEDSVIVNKSAVERGFANTTFFKSFEAKLEKNSNIGKSEIFFKPSPEKVQGVKKANYSKINNNGIIDEETAVEPHDAIIGKITPVDHISTDMDKSFRDTSTILKITEHGIVDKVLTNVKNADLEDICKVRLRQTRPPNIGDKFCYDNKTEILTNTGWKYFKDLNYSDKVATLKQSSNIFSYENPIEIVQYNYNGDMIELSNRYCNYCVTPNHKLYLKDDNNKNYLITADKTYRKNKIFQVNSSYKGNYTPYSNYRLYLHGLLISNGIFRQNKIYIKVMNNDFLISLCKKLNIIYRKCNNYYIIKTPELNTLFPNWLWNISTGKIKYFINGLFNNTNLYKTKNNKFINLIQKAIIHAGYQSKFYKIKSINYILLIKENIHYRHNSNSENIISYNDKIYCCTSNTGVICVRRNGITMWNGNSSRMGQKGTVGILLKHEDMPFSKTGLVPDIIMNPHAIPTRMSMGQMFDSIIGKINAIQGTSYDGSSFDKLDVHNFAKILKKYGFDESGDEELRCGYTGKKLTAKIFIGPTYYQRLKHMVEDKIHARAGDGPVSLLTREPPKGRAQNGGLRIGEMERDCFIAHGMSHYLKEKYIDSVDKYTCYICDKCGIMAHKKINLNYYICPLCKGTKEISKINTSYNFKLLLQELMSIGVKPKLILNETKYNKGLK